MLQTLQWRVNRLRCMTPAEISYRVLQAMRIRAQRAGLHGSDVPPAPALGRRSHAWIHADGGIDAAPYRAAADRIAQGRMDLFALHNAKVGSPPRWNRDPKTGQEAPLGFGMLLDYRNPRLVGDIKYLWEINRHMQLVTLAQAYALTRERGYFEVLRVQLESWLDACPFRLGPNWTSALEAGLRLINWSSAWQLLGGVDSPLFEDETGARLRRRWLASVYQHAEFVRGNFSRFSSANNHLLGEAAGLFVCALTWPHWSEQRRWLRTAKAILEREVAAQNAPDGVNREQAVWYQQFVLELLLLTLLAGKANAEWFSVAYESRVEAMLEFLASIMDVGGNVPMFGDADDGRVAPSDPGPANSNYRSLLAAGASLFGSSELRAKAGTLDDKARWLLGAEAAQGFLGASAPPVLPVRRAFPDGGYYVLGCSFETPEEIRLVADAGPLGYQTIAAHGHADALSFTLSVGGLEFLIDPGTYAYHTQTAWRSYFRGTAAHNTLRIDGRDQSVQGGNFMWLRKARAGCSLWQPGEERDRFEGWHDGYAALADPVQHRRSITLDKAGRRIVIEDRLFMAGEHLVELHFHCAEHCRLDPAGDGYVLSQGGRAVHLQLPQVEGASAQVHCGDTAPILGWVSRRFDQKQPTPTIAWRARLSGDTVLRSEILC
jgi:hypothetical protein